jgi:hypothetical protein
MGLGGPRGDAAEVTRCGGACQAGEGCGNFPRTLGGEFVHSRRNDAAQFVERAALSVIGIRDLRNRIERARPKALCCRCGRRRP